MRRLCWKEWQERRAWFVVWVLAAGAPAALGEGQPVFGLERVSGWIALPLLAALLAGLTAYGSEQTGTRAAFLFSRPVAWWQVLLAKLLPGVAAALVAIVVSALASLALAPAAHRPFMTLEHLAAAGGVMAGLSLLTYLLGLACSVPLPGLAGGILVLLFGYALEAVALYLDTNWLHRYSALAFLMIPVALLAAAIVIARFGLTLSAPARVWRYAVAVLAALAVLLPVALTPAVRRLTDPWFEGSTTRQVLVSPSGRYAFVRQWTSTPSSGVMRVGDSAWQPLPDKFFTVWNYRWLDGDVLLLEQRNDEQPIILAVRPGEATPVLRQFSCKDSLNSVAVSLSPDGRRLLIAGTSQLIVGDLATGRQTTLRNGRFAAWWLSDHQVGYESLEYNKRGTLVVE